MSLFPRIVPVVLCLVLLAGAAHGADDRLRPVAARPPAPAIDLPDLDGRTHRLADYRGPLVIVTFWASWCPQCIYEMPQLVELWHKRKARGLVLLAIDVDEPEAVAQQFAAEHRLDFPILLDAEMAAYKRWPVLGLPASYLVDGEGRIVFEAVGALDWMSPEVVDVVDRLLGSDVE